MSFQQYLVAFLWLQVLFGGLSILGSTDVADWMRRWITLDLIIGFIVFLVWSFQEIVINWDTWA